MMRRDIGFYIEADIATVYQAYLNAATHAPFERDCRKEPFHTIGFGLNYSMKYNMNGGSCTIHFMPSGSGTAVNMRFSLAQLGGARYERYAHNLNDAMRRFLQAPLRQAQYNMDEFLLPQNQVTPQTLGQTTPMQQGCAQTNAAPQTPTPESPTHQARVMVAPVPQARPGCCAKCAAHLEQGARFCIRCGTPVSAAKVCANCNTPASEGAAFCAQCGTKL